MWSTFRSFFFNEYLKFLLKLFRMTGFLPLPLVDAHYVFFHLYKHSWLAVKLGSSSVICLFKFRAFRWMIGPETGKPRSLSAQKERNKASPGISSLPFLAVLRSSKLSFEIYLEQKSSIFFSSRTLLMFLLQHQRHFLNSSPLSVLSNAFHFFSIVTAIFFCLIAITNSVHWYFTISELQSLSTEISAHTRASRTLLFPNWDDKGR